ncbi:MAG: DUF2975 domain-containing protein [Methanomassiliicoccaceae archaeon]|nr:DUF2975 domain-containing protein [Methanomassiliicoccaceae archaeon]
MSETLNRLNKISKYIGLGSKVLFVLLAIAIVFAFAVIVAVTLDPDLVGLFEPTVKNGQVLATCVTTICAGALGLIVLYYISRLFMNIYKNNTPFTDENVKTLEIIAIMAIVCAIAMPAASALSAYAFDAGYDQVIGFNAFTLFVAFLVYFLSLIFKYGAVLQKESDETL